MMALALSIESLCYYCGAAYLLYVSLRTLYGVLSLVRGFLIPTNVDLRKFGSWAIVTGSTDGIGRAYAEKLAKRGLNLILISRSQEKLNETAKSILSIYPEVKVKTIVADFTDENVYPRISAEISDIDIGMLVNNAAMTHTHPDAFVNYPVEFLPRIIRCNFLSATMLTSIVLPKFIAKKKGIIVNVSSIMGFIPAPYSSMYSSLKRGLQVFTEAIRIELSNNRDLSGIIVQDLSPGYVATKMSKEPERYLHCPNPSDYAESAVCSLTKLSNSAGCWSHHVQMMLLSNIPRWAIAWGVEKNQRRRQVRMMTPRKND